MSYNTKVFSIRLNWKHIEALEKLQGRFELSTKNKIITNCILWRASETVQEFEALERAHRAQYEEILKLQSLIRIIVGDHWRTCVRDNENLKLIFAKPKFTYEDYFYNITEGHYIPINSPKPKRKQLGKYETTYRGFS